ncbi:MAG: mechanosensitive ion channel [Bacteroidia bacterium]|nr:mechanosensitive ion channel [Bacteroidia bacterium]
MKKFIGLLYVSILFSSNLLLAQTDGKKDSNDAHNKAILERLGEQNQEIENQRLNDSLKKVELEEQIYLLKASNSLKKEELQKEIDALNYKETNRLTEKKARIDSLRASAKSYAVMGFFEDTLFKIYGNLGSFSAFDRAQAIQERIKKLKDDFSFDTSSIQVLENETTFDLYYKEIILLSISETDALWNNTSKLQLATNYKLLIEQAVLNYKKETSLLILAKEIGLALIVLLAMILIIAGLKWLSKWTDNKISINEGKIFKGIIIKNYTLFDSGRQVKVLLTLNKLVKWILILLTIYIALPIIFGIFPWTQHFTETLFGYILNPAKHIAKAIWHYLPNLFTIMVIVVFFRYAIKGIYFLKTEIENGKLRIKGFYPDWANPTYQIIIVVIYAFMAVVIFPYLPGSNSPIFKGVSVFLGVLFTFGSSGALSNVIAGLVLTYMRLFKIGDRVKIGEVVGDVIEKSLLVTRIRTIKNEIISIPNSSVMSSHTTNYSSDVKKRGLILNTTVTIGYDVPWKDIHQALLNAADKTEFILKDPKPFVLQTSLEDFYVAYQLNAYTKEPNLQAVIYSNLHSNIQDCCNEMGIEILSPHYRAARDGNKTTIPENYLDPNYKTPSFQVNLNSKDPKNNE